MNLAGMGSSGIDNVTKQMAASGDHGDGSHEAFASGSGSNQAGSSNMASNAGLITQMANI